ncbi:MAG: hypothetical protein R2706_18595 [Acidimicrobiales bacterium]
MSFRPVGPGIVIAEGWIEQTGKQTVFTENVLDGEETFWRKHPRRFDWCQTASDDPVHRGATGGR